MLFLLFLIGCLHGVDATLSYISSSNSACSASQSGTTITQSGVQTDSCYQTNGGVYEKWSCSGSSVIWSYDCDSTCSSCNQSKSCPLNSCCATGFNLGYFKPTSCSTDSAGSSGSVSVAGGWTRSGGSCTGPIASDAASQLCLNSYTATQAATGVFSAVSSSGSGCASVSAQMSGTNFSGSDSNGDSISGSLSGKTISLIVDAGSSGSCRLTYSLISSSAAQQVSLKLPVIAAIAALGAAVFVDV